MVCVLPSLLLVPVPESRTAAPGSPGLPPHRRRLCPVQSSRLCQLGCEILGKDKCATLHKISGKVQVFPLLPLLDLSNEKLPELLLLSE